MTRVENFEGDHMVLSCGGGGSVVSNKVIRGEGGLQKVINFPFHYSFPVVSFIFNCND